MEVDFCKYLISTIDWMFFSYASLLVSYLLFFAWAARYVKQKNIYPTAPNKHHTVIFIPAYKEDGVIKDTVSSFLKQQYPNEQYDIVVIADQLKPETIVSLKKYPIIITQVTFQNSTKAKALRYAIQKLEKCYDIAVILDADNIVEFDFLEKINNAFSAGQMAIQTHRKAKHLKTNMAILDAASEEINNTIFRQGHVHVGLSSALIGSGMAFDFKLFKENIMEVDENHVGEDKQLEILLLQKHIFIEYLGNVYTYDEKIAKPNHFFNQRRRWLSTQFSNLAIGINSFSQALQTKNWNYCDKLLQWTMPSRIVLAGIITLLAVIISCINFSFGIKWIVLTIILFSTLAISLPRYLINRKLFKAMFMVPFLFLLMLINHFRLAGADKKFIHTSHGE